MRACWRSGDFAQMIAGGAAAAALWAALGTGVGAIVRSQVGAVVGLCVWLLLIETVLAAYAALAVGAGALATEKRDLG
jgi:hypothetical protein